MSPSLELLVTHWGQEKEKTQGSGLYRLKTSTAFLASRKKGDVSTEPSGTHINRHSGVLGLRM
jgi:hypothetical protein